MSATARRVGGITVLGLCLLAAISGCVPQGEGKAARLARESGLQADLVTGSKFRHLVYRPAFAGESEVLHVYIEGDGRPFLEPTVVASDPTPRNPLMLRLMALDPAARVYLGRPCYFDLANDAGCQPAYWTVRRFAPEIVASMAAVLRSEAARLHASSIELYGHSGGGTLAILLAARVPEVTRVITIGPNLDTTAWCALHGYTPLLGSLNPVDMGLRLDHVRVLHLVGSKDTNTPPPFVEASAARMGESGSVQVVQGYTHNCCWERIWRGVLDQVENPASPPIGH